MLHHKWLRITVGFHHYGLNDNGRIQYEMLQKSLPSLEDCKKVIKDSADFPELYYERIVMEIKKQRNQLAQSRIVRTNIDINIDSVEIICKDVSYEIFSSNGFKPWWKTYYQSDIDFYTVTYHLAPQDWQVKEGKKIEYSAFVNINGEWKFFYPTNDFAD